MLNIARVILFLAITSLLVSCEERRNGSFVCHYGVPGGDEYAITNIVAEHIKQNYTFASRSEVDKTHTGKIYYYLPGCIPSFQFYEIIELDDIHVIEELAKQSLQLAGIDKVSLEFYEKQNWITHLNGGGHRGHENIIKKIIAER